MASLQEQLLKAGMVDEKKARKINKEKRKQAKQLPKGQDAPNESRQQALKTRAEKSARDREMNRQQQQLAEAKAITAQIKQLITVNRIDRQGGDIAYQFNDDSKIKKIYATTLLHTQLSNGVISIVKLNDQYELVPTAVADKISQRQQDIVIVQNQQTKKSIDDDDPYADYQIPDDLMW